MPSFAPKKTIPDYPRVDIAAVFYSPDTEASRLRTLKYIGNVFDKFAWASDESLYHPFLVTEVFELMMPTLQAYLDEVAVCDGIVDHAAGRLSDLQMKAILDKYIASHTFVYCGGVRRVKVGDENEYFDGRLFYLTSKQDANLAHTCNEIQVALAKALIEGVVFEVTEL